MIAHDTRLLEALGLPLAAPADRDSPDRARLRADACGAAAYGARTPAVAPADDTIAMLRGIAKAHAARWRRRCAGRGELVQVYLPLRTTSRWSAADGGTSIGLFDHDAMEGLIMPLPKHLAEAAARIDAARALPTTAESLAAWLAALTDHAHALADIQRYDDESIHEKLHALAGRLGLEHLL